MRVAVTLSSAKPSNFWILGFEVTTVTVYNYTNTPVYLKIGSTTIPTVSDYDFIIPPGSNTTYPARGETVFAAFLGPPQAGSIFSTSITDRVDLNFSDENEKPESNAGISISAISALAIGAPPPTSKSAGTGLWMDSTGIYGVNASVQQFIMSAITGAFTAGAGNVVLDANGLTMTNGSGGSSTNQKIKFISANAGASIYAYISAPAIQSLYITAGQDATGNLNYGSMYMRAYSTDNIGTRHYTGIELQAAVAAVGSLIDFLLDNGLASMRLASPAMGGFSVVAPTSITGTLSISEVLTSTVATGTAPLVVSSTTLNVNLNADMVDSLHAAASGANAHVLATDSAGKATLTTAGKVTALDLTAGGFVYLGSTNDGVPNAADMSGAKIVFYGGSATSQTAYGIGEEASFMWLNVGAGGGFKFYVAGVVKVTINSNGAILPAQYTTAGAPAYVKGAIYFDTTLNKLRIGGATAWETVTSV